jgi:beta-galactosidase GanA
VTIESSPPTGWTSGGFRLGQPDAKTFLDPQGRSFYVQGMTYAYEEVTDTLTAASVISELARMKELGFNTVNLYPRSGFNTPSTVQSDFLPEILSWADHNRMAVYVRVWYNPWVEFPDYMDPQYRDQARHSLDAALTLIRPHPSVLAVDLDQRWLLDVSWSGVRRYGVPRLMTQTLAYLPTWLQVRYGNVTALNTAWDRHYITFADVLSDTDIVRNRQVVDLDRHPWRLDLVEYTRWAMDDFMKDLIAYARSVDPITRSRIQTTAPRSSRFSPTRSSMGLISSRHSL